MTRTSRGEEDSRSESPGSDPGCGSWISSQPPAPAHDAQASSEVSGHLLKCENVNDGNIQLSDKIISPHSRIVVSVTRPAVQIVCLIISLVW